MIASALQLGLLYGLPALAVAVAFRVVGFPDLTPDGSFTFGAAVAGVIAANGSPGWLAIIASVLAGAGSGAFTALLHTRLGISKLLSGILVMTMLYSLSLRIMGTSNLSLMRVPSFMGKLGDQAGAFIPVYVIGAITGTVVFSLWAFLGTELGLRIRAVGDSESAMDQLGYAREPFYVIGLAVTNGLAGGGGALISQYQGFVDITMGTGLVVICLAAVIIGETFLRPQGSYALLTAPALGMLLYQGIVAVALRLGIAASDLKVATAMLALSFVALDRIRAKSSEGGKQIGNRSI